MITGLRQETFDHLQLNAGVFLVNFDGYDSPTVTTKAQIVEMLTDAINSNKCLGATIGGGSFVTEPQERTIDVDGLRGDVVGSTVYDGVRVRMTGTLKEITPEHIATTLSTNEISVMDLDDGKKYIVNIPAVLKKSNYLKNIVWVGDTSNGFMLIDLSNALNTAGMNFTFADKNEGSIPFDFRGHNDMSDLTGADKAPAKIYVFDFNE